ncbi:MAG: RNA polymerase sigma factor [Acidobacteriota bacterium]
MLLHKETVTLLVRRAQTGDEVAFAELVRLYQDIAVAYATSILGDYHLAEDAAQEAFVEAHRELPNLREPAAFPAWFRLIVFKHCDRLTRRKQFPITGLEAALEIAAPQPSPQQTLETRATQQAVREAIATLSEAEREVVLLYYLGEHSTGAIAAFLEITANTVKTRLYAAHKRLKKFMNHIEENLNGAPVQRSAICRKGATYDPTRSAEEKRTVDVVNGNGHGCLGNVLRLHHG